MPELAYHAAAQPPVQKPIERPMTDADTVEHLIAMRRSDLPITDWHALHAEAVVRVRYLLNASHDSVTGGWAEYDLAKRLSDAFGFSFDDEQRAVIIDRREAERAARRDMRRECGQ